VLQAPHEAQWERYFAPTIYEGKVYVDGGYYGGMYAFDQFSGEQEWFLELPQYDQWTPAVDASLAYSYVGEYSPGLYAADRVTGALNFVIPDPNFEWDGWSMNLAPVLGDHDDLIVVHDGRLISFDLEARSIGWELQRQFTGQPTVANDKIYAIDAGHLVVLDEVSQADLWSWEPPAGSLQGAMILTDTHLLASTATAVYAVDLATREATWSFPAGGHLAIGDGALYIASSDGTLTAVSIGEFVPAPLVRLEVSGPPEVVESSSAAYRAVAYYEDGRVRDRSLAAEWSVAPGTYASIEPGGVLTTAELLQPAQDVVVRARYAESGQTVEATRVVRLLIGVSLPQFIRRNLEASIEIKEQVVRDLEAALARERAARDVLAEPSSRMPSQKRSLVEWSIDRELAAEDILRATIETLRQALDLPDAPSHRGPPRRPRREPKR
jgi:outer membrane protein assembly factor BamB